MLTIELDSLQFSPFTTLLRLLASSTNTSSGTKIKPLLQSISRESQIFGNDFIADSLEALIASLKAVESTTPSNLIFEFLDNCIMRTSQKPIKYQEAIDQMTSLT